MCLQRILGKEALGKPDIAANGLQHPLLGAHREVGPDVIEQCASGLGEVMAVGCKPLNGRLARVKHVLVVEAAPASGLDSVTYGANSLYIARLN